MDQGIIKKLKFHYRKRTITRILKHLEENTATPSTINLRSCISELSKVWTEEVKESTIANIFQKAFSEERSDEENLTLLEMKKSWGRLQYLGNIQEEIILEDYLNIYEQRTFSHVQTKITDFFTGM